MRIGPRNDSMTLCAKCHGSELSWLEETRFLGVFITRSRKFKCSVDNAKRFFYRTSNGIFGNVVRLASELLIYRRLACLVKGYS